MENSVSGDTGLTMAEQCSHLNANVNVKFVTLPRPRNPLIFSIPQAFSNSSLSLKDETRHSLAMLFSIRVIRPFIRPLWAFPLALTLAAGSALAISAPGLAQQDDPFSILAPPSALPEFATTAPSAPAGPHMTRDAYFEHRGSEGDVRLMTRWRIEETALDGTVLSTRTQRIGLGEDFAWSQSGEQRTILDFETDRALTIGPDGVLNTDLTAHVHQQMETFSRFTANGTRAEITGPSGAVFERFWIEAAMGVRASEVTILGDTDEEGSWLLRRREDTPPIIRITPGETGDNTDAGIFASWLRHKAPIHPDALAYFQDLDALPDAFSFVVFSPSSPDGRRERWTLMSSAQPVGGLPWPEDAAPASAASYDLPSEAMTQILDLGLRAAAANALIVDDVFLNEAQAFNQAGDKSGAYLTLYQASHHQQACTPQVNTPVCRQLNRAIVGAIGDAQMEALITTVSSGMRDPASMLDRLEPHVERRGMAGAAANLLAAQAAAALFEAGTPSDHDPLSFFLRAAESDPATPMIYWHAGRFAVINRDYATAWLLFDIARSLPAEQSGIARGDAGALKSQLESVAPAYFGPPTQPALPTQP